MRQTSFSDMHCSIARSLDVVGDWWSPLIIRDIFLGLNRFDELVDDLGISRNVLTTRLEGLVAAAIIAKVAYQDRPRRFEYRLTDAGEELIPVLMALMAWGDKWQAGPDGPPMVLVDNETGKPFVPTVFNPDTGARVDARQVTAVPGPGGRSAPGTALLPSRAALPPVAD